MSKKDFSVSKSERKRQMHALHRLGELLVNLPQSELDKIEISDLRLQEAISVAKRISARSALKRQLKFIAKLMREVDPEPIRQGLTRLNSQNRLSATRFKRIEVARNRLVKNGESAFEDILGIWPTADIIRLRQLVHELNLAKENGRQKEHEKRLFRYLSELDETSIPEPPSVSDSRPI